MINLFFSHNRLKWKQQYSAATNQKLSSYSIMINSLTNIKVSATQISYIITFTPFTPGSPGGPFIREMQW